MTAIADSRGARLDAGRPTRRARRARSSCRPRTTSCSRPTWTCARPSSTRSSPTSSRRRGAGLDGAAGGRGRRSSRSREDRVVARALSAEAARARASSSTPRCAASAIGRTCCPRSESWSSPARACPTTTRSRRSRARRSSGLACSSTSRPDVQLSAPLVIRWSVGVGGRGLITRTLIDLARNAHATILEEQVPSTQASVERRPGAVVGHQRGPPRRRRDARLRRPAGLRRRHARRSSTARPASAATRSSAGRSPASAASSRRAASTTCSRVAAPPSTRWRSASAPATSCST